MKDTKDLNFTGKVALVTGASSGIGQATAELFALKGADIIMIDTDEMAAKAPMANIERLGRRVLFEKCDVQSSTEVKRAIASAVENFGRIDFAFNNAGVEGEQRFTIDASEENWDKVLAVNLKSIWLSLKYEIAQMLKQGGGSIVNCSSIAGLIGFPGISAYVASKHGVIGLTKTAALEYARSNIRINAVCPGIIQTPMIDRFTHGDKAERAQLETSGPLGRMGLPEEVAEAVVWLCSSRASFVTGHSLTIDGGWVAE